MDPLHARPSFPLAGGSGLHYPSPDLDELYLPYVWPQGYSVRAPLLAAYLALGGPEALGPPITQPWTDPESGTVSQTFAHGLLSLPPGGPPRLLPLLDLLSASGRDDWLLAAHGIPGPSIAPPPGPPDDTLPIDALAPDHLALLSHNSYFWSHFLGTRDWSHRFGFPTVYSDTPLHGPTLRTQKTVLRLTPDKVVYQVAAGRLLRAWTDGSLIPIESLPAELSDRWVEPVPDPLPEPPPDTLGPAPTILSTDPVYHRWMTAILLDLRETKPEFFRYVTRYAQYVTDGAFPYLPDGTPIPYADVPEVRVWTISFALPQLRTVAIPHLNRTPAERLSPLAHWFIQGLFVHEATHLRLCVQRRKWDGRFSEAVCETERLRFFRAAHHLVTDTTPNHSPDFLLPGLQAPASAAAMADRLQSTLPTMGLQDYHAYLLSLADD